MEQNMSQRKAFRQKFLISLYRQHFEKSQALIHLSNLDHELAMALRYLIDKGLVEREAIVGLPSDVKGSYVRLTAKGMDAIESNHPLEHL